MPVGQRIANQTGPVAGNVSDSLIAAAGGTQAAALALTSSFNRVTTVASANDSVKLPPWTYTPNQINSVGAQIYVINSGANSMQVFGAGTDTINGVATATGIALPAGQNAIFTLGSVTAAGVGLWYGVISQPVVPNFAVTNPIKTFGFWPAAIATSGTDTFGVNGTRWWSSIYIPYSCTITGLAYLIGSVGGTDKVIVELHDNAGVMLATSALAGATVGTTATMQQVAFTAPLSVVGPGVFYAVVQTNGATAKIRTVPASVFGLANTMVTGSVAGTFGTSAAITPGAAFVADSGPIVTTY